MDLDDLFAKPPKAAATIGEDLSRMSVDELERRLAALSEERARVEAEMLRKRALKAAAEDVFKRG
jgi:uncharacterized small protein (DUF1192 family)